MKIQNLYKNDIITDSNDNIIHKYSEKETETTSELLIEHNIKLLINDIEFASLVCTGNNLSELIVGRCISEGFVESINEIDRIFICEYGLKARVYLTSGISISDRVYGETNVASCCSDNKNYFKSKIKIKKIESNKKVTEDDILCLTKRFNNDSTIHKLTSGTHAAYLYSDNKIIASFEDIGRHNALDKAIGYMYINEYNPTNCILFTTGRVPVDMVRKAIYANVSALVTKAVPTVDAIKLAKEYNLTLICRAWPDSYQIFT